MATRTTVKDGKIVRKKIIDWRSSWLGSGNGTLTKRAVESTFTVVEGEGDAAKTTVEKRREVDDGTMSREYDPIRKIWSEQAHFSTDTDVSTAFARHLDDNIDFLQCRQPIQDFPRAAEPDNRHE